MARRLFLPKTLNPPPHHHLLLRFASPFSTSFLITKTPKHLKKRRKKPDSPRTKPVQHPSTKIPHFESLLDRDAYFRFLTKTKQFLSQQPECILPLADAGKLHQQLGFPRGRNVTRSIQRHPLLFQTYRHTDNKMWFGFTNFMEELLQEEKQIMNSMEADRVIKSSKVRQCDKCRTSKPTRAHHCRVCRRCVLRMDHHCLWINNCVGYRNYKAFLTLVFYATVTSVYSEVVITCCALKKWDVPATVPMKVFYVVSAVMMFFLCATLGTLLGWHIYLISRNMTTIEYYESIRAAWLSRKSGQTYRHPFNVSMYKNITAVLGPNIMKWLWPTAVSHLQDGFSYPTSHNS